MDTTATGRRRNRSWPEELKREIVAASFSPGSSVSVSVRRVLESYESSVIQGWWPDSRRVTDVDEQEPRPLRPQQVAISERSDRRRMETGRTADPARQDWRWQADGDHA